MNCTNPASKVFSPATVLHVSSKYPPSVLIHEENLPFKFSLCFANCTTGAFLVAILLAKASAAGSNLSSGNTRATRPRLYSWAPQSKEEDICIKSIARAFSRARVIRWIPPTPRMVSSVSSGRPGSCQLCGERIESRRRKRNRTDYTPNCASSAAYMISHIIASSNPPPRAEPATAAIMGLRIDVTADDRSFRYSSASLKSAPAVEYMSVPSSQILTSNHGTYQQMDPQSYCLSKPQP